MANPKRKHSHSRGRKRRTGKGLRSLATSSCPQCKNVKPPHRVCPFCGHYDGKEVVIIERKPKKKQK